MIQESLIKNLVEKVIAETDIFLIEVKVKLGNKILIVLDSDSAVKIDDCIKVSRYVESNLDRETEDFELEVTSAGLDSPFKNIRQYIKNQGKEVSVTKTDGKVIKGILISVNNEDICIKELKPKKKQEISEFNINFKEIKETKIIISFK